MLIPTDFVKYRNDIRYLCKAKRSDDNNWTIGYYVKGLDSNKFPTHFIIDPDNYDNYKGFSGKHIVNPNTLCSCTGFRDKFGDYIFEGDILKITNTTPVNVKITIIVEVQWFNEHGAYLIWNDKQNKLNWLYDNDFRNTEIIGNVYDKGE